MESKGPRVFWGRGSHKLVTMGDLFGCEFLVNKNSRIQDDRKTGNPMEPICAIGSINSHYFHIIGDGKLNPIIGFYIPIIRIPIKSGMTIPNIATFDHGTYNTFIDSLNLCHHEWGIPKLQAALSWKFL